MSCGNRFQCGITRFQKHSFTPDRPSNPELHNENQKRLSDLLKAREDLDKLITGGSSLVSEDTMKNKIKTPTIENTIDCLKSSTLNEQYTPWKTPSSQ